MTILENKKLDSNHAQNDNLSKTKSFSKTNSNDPMNITIFIGNSDIQAGLDEFWNSKHDDYARLNNLKPSVNTCKTTGSLVTTNKSQISGKGLRFAISFSGRNSRNSRNSRKSGKDGAVSTRSGSIKNYNKRKISEATVNSVSATASHVGMASSTANTATSVRTIFTDKCCTCILCCFKIDNADNLSLNELSQLNDTDEEGDLTNLDVKERKQSQAPEKKRSLLESDNQQITTTLSEILGRGNFELCHEEVCQELDLNLEECLAWEEKFSNLRLGLISFL